MAVFVAKTTVVLLTVASLLWYKSKDGREKEVRVTASTRWGPSHNLQGCRRATTFRCIEAVGAAIDEGRSSWGPLARIMRIPKMVHALPCRGNMPSRRGFDRRGVTERNGLRERSHKSQNANESAQRTSGKCACNWPERDSSHGRARWRRYLSEPKD